jgi:hypothetical protein
MKAPLLKPAVADRHRGSDAPNLRIPRAKPRWIASAGHGQWLTSTRFWATSAVLHLAVLLVLLSVRMAAPPTEERATIVMRNRPPPVPYRPAPVRDLAPTPPLPMPRSEVVRTPLFRPSPPRAPQRTTPRPNVLPPSVVGPAPASSFLHRSGKKGLTAGGGGSPTEDAVRAALEWLRRHQSADGSWKAKGFTQGCRTICRNKDAPHSEGDGFPEHDVGVTSLAVLAFTGYGHTHRVGNVPRYVAVLRKAVDYLKRSQFHSTDPATHGRFGPADHEQWIYDHALATLAMGELLNMSQDVIGLERPVRNAVNLCLAARNEGFGWRYGVQPGDNDSSVTGWMVLALKTAKNARVGIPEAAFDSAFDGALNWFRRVTPANGRTGYAVPGDEGSRLNLVYPEPYPYSKQLSSMTGVSTLCRLFAGESRTSSSVQGGVDVLLRSLPEWRAAPKDARALP